MPQHTSPEFLKMREDAIRSEIDRVDGLDESEGIQPIPGNEFLDGIAVENRVVGALKQTDVFLVAEHAPLSLDQKKGEGSGKVDVILMLPSGLPIGVQLFAERDALGNSFQETFAVKARDTITHGVSTLTREDARGRSHPAFVGLPMPIAFVALNEQLILSEKTTDADITRAFLTQLLTGVSPDIRTRYLIEGDPDPSIAFNIDRRMALEKRFDVPELQQYYREVEDLVATRSPSAPISAM